MELLQNRLFTGFKIDHFVFRAALYLTRWLERHSVRKFQLLRQFALKEGDTGVAPLTQFGRQEHSGDHRRREQYFDEVVSHRGVLEQFRYPHAIIASAPRGPRGFSGFRFLSCPRSGIVGLWLLAS